MKTELKDIIMAIIRVEDCLSSGTELTSNQGQALDGFSALANFRDLAWKLKKQSSGKTRKIKKIVVF